MSVEQQPVSVEKLTIVSLAVEKQEEALEWYQEKLGFVIRADAPFEMNGETGRWLTISPPGNEEIEIALLEPDEDLYEGEMLERIEEMCGTDPMWTFTTADMDAAVADLKERGVDVDDEIRDTPWGRSACSGISTATRSSSTRAWIWASKPHDLKQQAPAAARCVL